VRQDGSSALAILCVHLGGRDEVLGGLINDYYREAA
jgi:hypothetical protein